MTSTGHFPTAVSPVTITAAAPSATALKISLTSARVGTGFCSMDASICVTTMNGFPALRHWASIRFWAAGSSHRGMAFPRSPLAMTISSAIQMPALVIGQLSSRSNHHLEKMENKWLANQYQEKLRQVSVALGTSIPATLNLEQQSYFALGYYQMGAKLSQEKKERSAAGEKAAAEE